MHTIVYYIYILYIQNILSTNSHSRHCVDKICIALELSIAQGKHYEISGKQLGNVHVPSEFSLSYRESVYWRWQIISDLKWKNAV